jgi:rhodanese-related sulfurtransferase
MTTSLTLLNDEALQAQAADLQKMIIIDIRSPSEYAREHIPGSQNIPTDKLSQADTSQWENASLMFYCKSGNRTQQSKTIIDNIPCIQKLALSGGIEQWKRCGQPTETHTNAPLELMRQVQIIAGSLIILGVILGFIFSSYFILLSLFVGIGLLFAGATGFCGMANLLMLLPYNKQ